MPLWKTFKSGGTINAKQQQPPHRRTVEEAGTHSNSIGDGSTLPPPPPKHPRGRGLASRKDGEGARWNAYEMYVFSTFKMATYARLS